MRGSASLSRTFEGTQDPRRVLRKLGSVTFADALLLLLGVSPTRRTSVSSLRQRAGTRFVLEADAT